MDTSQTPVRGCWSTATFRQEQHPHFRYALRMILRYPLNSKEYFAEIESGRLPLFINGCYGTYPDPHTYAYSYSKTGYK